MINLLTTQNFQVLEPVVVNGGTATAFYVDTLGADWVRIVLLTGAIGASNITKYIVTECETSGGSYTDITGSGATFTATDDGKIVITDVDYRSKGTRKRFLSVTVTAGATDCLVAALAMVSPKPGTPTSTSNVGAGCLGGVTKSVLAWNQV